MTKILAALWCGCWFTALAQIGGDYLGPGILSTGAGNIGQRSGEQVDLRFFADVMGVYDNGLEPFSLNSKGQLYTVNGLYGEQVDAGIYGQHAWKRAVLGLDLRGNYYHYDNDSYFDGSAANATLGFTYQKSRRLIFGLRGTAGTTKIGFGVPGYYTPPEGTVVGQQSAILFDNRLYYLQGSASMTYVMTPRTSFTVGGQGFDSQYAASGLIGVYGYAGYGAVQHRLSRTKTVGALYQRMHYQFVRSYGYADLNIAELFVAAQITRRWNFSLGAGAAQSGVQAVEQISLNPVVAALLGTSFGFQTYHSTTYYPYGSASLTGKFKTSLFSATYSKTIAPGNGIYLTSRQDSGSATYSYTGIHNWNFGLSAGYSRLGAISQGLQPYSAFIGGLGITYNLTRAFHAVARYDFRHQDINAIGYRRDGSRVSLGIGWSPGDVPLSLW